MTANQKDGQIIRERKRERERERENERIREKKTERHSEVEMNTVFAYLN